MIVPACRGKNDQVRTSPLQLCDHRVQQHAADALIAMFRFRKEIVHDTCRPSKRHVIISVDRSIGIADDRFFLLGGKNHDIGFFQLTLQPSSIEGLCIGSRCEEALWVPMVVERHQQRHRYQARPYLLPWRL